MSKGGVFGLAGGWLSFLVALSLDKGVCLSSIAVVRA